jgi:hypothetical protein
MTRIEKLANRIAEWLADEADDDAEFCAVHALDLFDDSEFQTLVRYQIALAVPQTPRAAEQSECLSAEARNAGATF